MLGLRAPAEGSGGRRAGEQGKAGRDFGWDTRVSAMRRAVKVVGAKRAVLSGSGGRAGVARFCE